MLAHANCLSSEGYKVEFIGFNEGSNLPSHILNDSNITIHFLPSFHIKDLNKYFHFLFSPIKVFLQFFSLLLLFFFKNMRYSEFLLVQNPPALPTLLNAYILCWLSGCKLIIDWHNFGYTILALKHGENSFIVKVYKYLETTFGRKADLHFCVSNAMKKVLIEDTELGILVES